MQKRRQLPLPPLPPPPRRPIQVSNCLQRDRPIHQTVHEHHNLFQFVERGALIVLYLGPRNVIGQEDVADARNVLVSVDCTRVSALIVKCEGTGMLP